MNNIILRQTAGTETVSISVIEALYNIAINNNIDSTFEGNLFVPKGYQEQIDYLNANTGLSISCNTWYIKFEDPVVDQICATNFGDGNGTTAALLAAVTSQDSMAVFYNANITKFRELRYFTSITYSSGISATNWNHWLRGNPNLEEVDFSNFTGNKGDLSDYTKLTYIGICRGNLPKIKNCTNLDPDMSQVTSLIQGNCYNCGITQINAPNLTGNLALATFTKCSKLVSVWDLGTITTFSGADWDPSGEWGPPFNENTNLERVILPSTLTTITSWSFRNCSKLKYIKLLATTPPTLGDNVIGRTYNGSTLGNAIWYVPDAAYTTYTTATGWSLVYANGRLKTMSDWATDWPNEPTGPSNN